MKGSLFSVLLFCFMNKGLSSPIPSTIASTTSPLTTTPFTTQIPGCEYDGKIYPPGADIPELRGECYGASCSGDSGLFFIMHWDTFNCGVETSCKYRLCLIVLSVHLTDVAVLIFIKLKIGRLNTIYQKII